MPSIAAQEMIRNEGACFCCESTDAFDFFSTTPINGYFLKKCPKCSVIVAQAVNVVECFNYADYGEYMIVAAEEVENSVRRTMASSRTLLSAIQERFGSDAAVLDFGCGAGYFVKAAAEFGFDAAGVEASSRLRNFSRDTLGLHIHEKLDDVKESFDVVSAFDVVEHLPPENSRELLRQLLSLLKPGGIFAGNTPNVNSLNVRLLGEKEPVIAPPSHICYFTMASLDCFLRSLGLTRLSVSTEGFALGSFFRTNKFQPSFLEKPCTSRLKRLFMQKPLDLIQKAISAAVSGAGLGYQIHFQYMKPK